MGEAEKNIKCIPTLKNKICQLTKNFENLDYVQTIQNLTLNGSNLEITFINNLGVAQTLSQNLFTIQEAEIKDNVLNYAALSSILAPDLYQFAYVRESQGTRFINYKGSGLYMWNGAEWTEDDTDVFNQLQILIDNLNLEIQERINADNLLSDRITTLENLELIELVDSNDTHVGIIRK